LAACAPTQFAKIHDHIFERQSELSNENLKKWENKFGLKDCFESEKIQEEIQKSMRVGEQYNLKSTPTIIINGRKIEGSIPTIHLRAILKSLIK
jgi:protein-disulfide isomerase